MPAQKNGAPSGWIPHNEGSEWTFQASRLETINNKKTRWFQDGNHNCWARKLYCGTFLPAAPRFCATTAVHNIYSLGFCSTRHKRRGRARSMKKKFSNVINIFFTTPLAWEERKSCGKKLLITKHKAIIKTFPSSAHCPGPQKKSFAFCSGGALWKAKRSGIGRESEWIQIEV